MPTHDDLDLFRSGGSEDGYERWRAENRAERRAEAERQKAELLPLAADETGFSNWREEAEAARQDFARRWGTPIGKRVRVELVDGSLPFEGVLSFVESRQRGHRRQVLLSVGGRVFPSGQVQSLVRLD